ncbi:TPA: DUF1273 domain-containing protein [Streptococcus suis]
MHTKSLLIAGYKHTELGIFSDKDPKLTLIKKVIRTDLVKFLEDGLEWCVFSGNLGFEYWVLEVLRELIEEGYECKIATIFAFENHGQNWNEANQERLSQFKQVDFVKYAFPSYTNPGQFKEYNQFLVNNTDGSYVFYDSENETNLKFLYHLMVTQADYNRKTLTFDDLNEMAENFSNFE